MAKKGELRHGRRKPGNIYLQAGDEPSDADEQITWIPDITLARRIVRAYNTLLAKENSDGAQEKR